MTDRLVFHSSFDSTRFTAVHPGDFPNLAQAQAEAVISLLLGRSLAFNNTYAFDSRSAQDLVATILETRERVGNRVNPRGRQRINAADPLILRWYAPAGSEMDFLACCADQLRRLAPGTRFILSHWKMIDDQDKAREELAAALAADEPRPPAFLRENDELNRSFQTLRQLSEYARGPGRGQPTGQPQISLLDYLVDFERLDDAGLDRLVAAMTYPIDWASAITLREAIAQVRLGVKKNRGWAHEAVNQAGGEQKCPPFLLEQRQLVDTLYNAVLADSVGSGSEFLSSVPRTVSNDNLKMVNGLALELIRYSRASREVPATEGRPSADYLAPEPGMSGLFVAASEEPDLPAAPLAALLEAYWELIADDDLSQPWSDSCDQLDRALRRAERLHLMGHPADSQLGDCWDAHLDMLHARLEHIQTGERRLGAAIKLGARSYCQLNLLDTADPVRQAESLATGQYIDQSLRKTA
jgi:hypothetical protein